MVELRSCGAGIDERVELWMSSSEMSTAMLQFQYASNMLPICFNMVFLRHSYARIAIPRRTYWTQWLAFLAAFRFTLVKSYQLVYRILQLPSRRILA